VGNKSDLENEVDRKEAGEFACLNGMQFFELNCIEDAYFNEVSRKILQAMVRIIPKNPRPENFHKSNIILGKKLLSNNKFQLVS
jgi:hypothetical protein